MDRETFTEAIEALRRRRPYQPFTITLVTGERLEVDRPEVLAIRDGAAFVWAPGHIPWIFDHEGVSHIVGDLAGRKTEE